MKNTKYKLFLLVSKYMPARPFISRAMNNYIGRFDKSLTAIQDSNVWDVYVALNAQYHDYYTLYYEWLDGDEAKVHEKTILSAITFWFKDEDAKEGKVWDYFND